MCEKLLINIYMYSVNSFVVTSFVDGYTSLLQAHWSQIEFSLKKLVYYFLWRV